MPNLGLNIDAVTAFSYIGKTVLVELVWNDDPEPLWRFKHIVGIVLPVSGIFENAYFMTMDTNGLDPFPNEMFFENIRTIRVMQYRDRHGSGNVLGCIAHPNSAESGDALPARRNSSTVPSNGSTGAAHP
ncbi:hypothetical protein ACQKFS_15700 [Pseudomonas guineae]|uniref:hypothetical protein n=1 Tax=Pseudomonas guineae TaxID=425504 RepID=UPI003D03556A